jgi:hypothetical protein
MVKSLEKIALKAVCDNVVSSLSSSNLTAADVEDEISPPPVKNKMKLDSDYVVSDFKKDAERVSSGRTQTLN